MCHCHDGTAFLKHKKEVFHVLNPPSQRLYSVSANANTVQGDRVISSLFIFGHIVFVIAKMQSLTQMSFSLSVDLAISCDPKLSQGPDRYP